MTRSPTSRQQQRHPHTFCLTVCMSVCILSGPSIGLLTTFPLLLWELLQISALLLTAQLLSAAALLSLCAFSILTLSVFSFLHSLSEI